MHACTRKLLIFTMTSVNLCSSRLSAVAVLGNHRLVSYNAGDCRASLQTAGNTLSINKDFATECGQTKNISSQQRFCLQQDFG
ncbi:hypothetical protein J6590_055627 [Homalodisca vitripennis]|nr:hypothetical protein J6590_055627 [Homalodisca vitripennis]